MCRVNIARNIINVEKVILQPTGARDICSAALHNMHSSKMLKCQPDRPHIPIFALRWIWSSGPRVSRSDLILAMCLIVLPLVPLCRSEAGLLVTPKYGYFRNVLPLVPVVSLFSPLFFLLCLSQISLHTILPS